MRSHRILVVDDEESIRGILERVLLARSCEVRAAASVADAIAVMENWQPDVALVDLVLPERDGIELLRHVKTLGVDTEVVMMTGNGSVQTALEAVRLGAYDYMEKPFESMDDLWRRVQRAAEHRALVLKNRELLNDQERKSREISAHADMSGSGEDRGDLDSVREILNDFLRVVVEELSVDRASLMLFNRSREHLWIAASTGIVGVDLDEVRVPLGEGIAGRVAQTGAPFLVTDTDQRREVGPRQYANLSSSFISAPIVCSVAIKSERAILGVINVTNRTTGESFTSNDVSFLSGLASQLGVVLESARRSRKLHEAYESLKATQEKLVFSERLKAVGQMAAGVAHDFNNALSVILARAQSALGQLCEPETDLERLRVHLQTIIKTSLLGAETIQRIQDYTRIRKDAPSSPVDLGGVVRDAIEISRPKWKEEAEARGRKIEIVTELEQIPKVSGNRFELTQVVGNLIFNAVEAMPEGGKITCKTRRDDDEVVVEVGDDGIGMDADTRKRLFEPFFSTKATGQGLGTSIVFGIVSRHRGTIDVSSAPGMGTTFTIRLRPIECGADAVEEEAEAEAEVSIEPRAVTVDILLVDDDEMVRETYEEVLADAGHRVTVASSGNEALDLCRRQSFELVITDLTMSGMSGLQLASALKGLGGETAVMLFSGWALQELGPNIAAAGVDRLLYKPCLIEDLLQAVQEIVAERRPIGAGV